MGLSFLKSDVSRKKIYIGLFFLLLMVCALLGDFGHANPILFGLSMFMLYAGMVLLWLLIACSFIRKGYRWFWAIPVVFIFCLVLGWATLFISSHHGESSFNYSLLIAPISFSLPSFVTGGVIYVFIMNIRKEREGRIERIARWFLVVFCGCFLIVLNVGLFLVPCLNYYSDNRYLEKVAKKAVYEKYGEPEYYLILDKVGFFESEGRVTDDLEFVFISRFNSAIDPKYYYTVCVSRHGGAWHLYRGSIFYPGK